MASKTVIGALLIVILAASIAVTMNDVRIKATASSTTFYVFQNGNWLTGGVESNQLYNGSKSISRGVTSLNSLPSGGEYKIIRTATYGKATVIDTYLFDGTVTNKELFPIYHTIQILNGKGLTYQYTAGSLQYSGPSLKNVPSPQSFGRNMKIYFQDGWTSNTLSGSSLKVKYAVTSNDQTFNIRMFDPLVAPQWSNNQSSYPATYSPSTASTFNITWTAVNSTPTLDTVLIEGNWSGTATNYTSIFNHYTKSTFNDSSSSYTYIGSSSATKWIDFGDNVVVGTGVINITGSIAGTLYNQSSGSATTGWRVGSGNNDDGQPPYPGDTNTNAFINASIDSTNKTGQCQWGAGYWCYEDYGYTNYTFITNISSNITVKNTEWKWGYGPYGRSNALYLDCWSTAWTTAATFTGTFQTWESRSTTLPSSCYNSTAENKVMLRWRVQIEGYSPGYAGASFTSLNVSDEYIYYSNASSSPSNVKLYVDGTTAYNGVGELNNKTQLSVNCSSLCNVTVKTDTQGSIVLDAININYMFTNLSNASYSNILPAGHWYWKSYANDSSGSWNSTPSWFFDIGQLPNPLTLTLNNSGNMSCTYPCVSNASGNGNLTVANLYRNSILKNSENKVAIQLAAGTHVYIFNTSGNQNYSANSTSLWLIVNQYTTTLSLWVNGTSGDQTRDSGILNITAALDVIKSLLLYRNGTLLQTSTTPLINISNWGTAGVFNVTAWFAGDENYTSAISSLNLHIDVINASISLPPSTRFRINATSNTGNFTPFNQTSVMPIFNVTNTGIAAINVSMRLNASLPSCMATSMVSTNSTFEWPGVNITDADYNVTGTTWVQVISNLGVGQSQGIWTQVEYNSCPVGTTYTFNRQWNVTRAV